MRMLSDSHLGVEEPGIKEEMFGARAIKQQEGYLFCIWLLDSISGTTYGPLSMVRNDP